MVCARLPAQSLVQGAPLGVRNILHVTALDLFHITIPPPHTHTRGYGLLESGSLVHYLELPRAKIAFWVGLMA